MNEPKLTNRKDQKRGDMEFYESMIEALRLEGYPQWFKLRKKLNGVFDTLSTLQQQNSRAKELLGWFVERTAIDGSYTHTPQYAEAKELSNPLQSLQDKV